LLIIFIMRFWDLIIRNGWLAELMFKLVGLIRARKTPVGICARPPSQKQGGWGTPDLWMGEKKQWVRHPPENSLGVCQDFYARGQVPPLAAKAGLILRGLRHG